MRFIWWGRSGDCLLLLQIHWVKLHRVEAAFGRRASDTRESFDRSVLGGSIWLTIGIWHFCSFNRVVLVCDRLSAIDFIVPGAGSFVGRVFGSIFSPGLAQRFSWAQWSLSNWVCDCPSAKSGLRPYTGFFEGVRIDGIEF